MQLLNTIIPLINTYNPAEPTITFTENPTSGINELRNFKEFDAKAWYCLFSCEHSFEIYKIRDLVDPVFLKKVLDKKAFLVLDNALEPFERSINSIYKYVVIEGQIPASQVILLTNMPDAGMHSRAIAGEYNTEPIRVLWYNLFESDLHYAVHHVYKDNVPKTLRLKEYPKKFLNLNRRWRLHRPVLTTLLYNRNLLDKGYISFGPCDGGDTWEKRWPEMQHYFRQDKEMLELLEKSTGVQQLPPMYLDTNELHINRAEATVDTNQYYADTYFSVVSETTCFTKEWYSSARFLSEKAWKPVAMKHPFIMVSVPRTLEVFKQMGYKTFSPIINESYDQEQDDTKRLLMIVDEIERLSNLTQVELEKFLIAAREICEHNYNVLMSKKTFITEI
jgi:hypothetical protein